LRGRTIVDLRNIYRPEDMARRAFDYISIGRPPVNGASKPAEHERPAGTPSLPDMSCQLNAAQRRNGGSAT
jgi:hypothetical protein